MYVFQKRFKMLKPTVCRLLKHKIFQKTTLRTVLRHRFQSKEVLKGKLLESLILVKKNVFFFCLHVYLSMLYLSIFFSFVYKEPDEIFECLRFRPTIYRFIQPKANVYWMYFIGISFFFKQK